MNESFSEYLRSFMRGQMRVIVCVSSAWGLMLLGAVSLVAKFSH